MEAKYTTEEICAAAKKFGAEKFLVKTALDMTGKNKFTLAEAKKIINDFKKKAVH